MGIIYIIKNLVNHKIYVGQTTSSLSERWKGHLSSHKEYNKDPSKSRSWALYNAFNKYGLDNFVIINFKVVDNDKLDETEIFYIKVFQSLTPNGYNIRSGGARGLHSEVSKEKMRIAKLGAKNHNFGKPRSEEFKQKMSEKKSGENHHYYGKNLEENHKLKLSESHKKDGLSEGLPMYMVYVKQRPAPKYCYGGYAIVNHPNIKNKYFTSKKMTMQEKYDLALEYLNTQINQISE